MDTKITLSFNNNVIEKAKQFADENNISLSRLTEFLYDQLTKKNYKSLYDIPVSDWVDAVAEEQAVYITKKKSSKELRNEFYEKPSKKK